MTDRRQHAILTRPSVSIGPEITFGSGKIELLRHVAQEHSISGAARALGMTYKRAWQLIDTLNQGFGKPVVETTSGGKGGGGAHLTPLGEALVAGYLALEARLSAAAQADLDVLGELAD